MLPVNPIVPHLWVSDSDLAERSLALYPRDGWLYIMLSYFDESTCEREAMPAAAVSALSATGKQWSQFSKAWMNILQDPTFDVCDSKGRRIFHANEFETPEGRRGTVYEHWSDDKCLWFNRALCDAIVDHGIQVSAASVIVAEYDEVASQVETVIETATGIEVTESRKVLYGDRYVFCAQWAMVLASEVCQLYFPKSTEVAYFFESGGGYQRAVEGIYDIAIERQRSRFRFFSKPNFVDKEYAVALQAADKMAYEASKHTSHIRDPNPPIKHSTPNESGQRVWNTRYPLQHLTDNSTDLHLRHWLKQDIEAFFEESARNREKKRLSRSPSS